MKQQIKDEIYKYVQTLDLTEEEIGEIDTYVNSMLEYLEPIFISQDNIVENDELFQTFKKLVNEQLGE